MIGYPGYMRFGIDVLLRDTKFLAKLKASKIGLVGHQASVTDKMDHSLDALIHAGANITCAFGPQHGMRGEKQYNMIESEDYVDPIHKIPVFSLYGKSRHPTAEMLAHCDGVIVDLQDVGCRIYTYLTTLGYVMQEAAKHKKWVWVLDRPNAAGRPVEGTILEPGQESFVGLGPMPMRHGFTLGEMAFWIRDHFKLNLDLQVIEMENYHPAAAGLGWPHARAWINPSPNIPNVPSARCYPGAVMLEGTTLSEGRGTTRPFEWFGAPDIDAREFISKMHTLAPDWMKGISIRPTFFEPTFYKHQGKLCSGIQLHAEGSNYNHKTFKPYRMMALAFKALRLTQPKYDLWRDFAYEYVTDRLPIDVITGGKFMREWVDNPSSTIAEFEKKCATDEQKWIGETEKYFIYEK